MMRRWMCLALSLLMLAFCASAWAESGEWKYDADYAILRGYEGEGGDVVVPGELEGYTVDVIDINVFKSDAITSLTLPETVLELRSNAVTWCENLKSVSLPESLIVINRMNFNTCDSLSEVTIPAGVRYIGSNSFRFCGALKKVTFEGVCPIIDKECFSLIGEGATAYVPDDQLEAYAAAFEKAGIELEIQPSGKNAVVVENNGFAEEDFDFDASTGTIVAYNGFATYLAIPETIGGVPVKAIGAEAFKYHQYLALLELPEGLEDIGDEAFYNCVTLGHVAFPSTLKTIGNNAFYNAYKGSTMELTSVEHIGDYAFYFAGFQGDMELPEGLKTIGESAFESCSNMGDLYLPSTLESIGSNAFRKDYNILYVVLNSVTPPALGADVFEGCDYLADIDLSDRGTRQQMLDWQAYVDELGLNCRVWRAQDPTAQSPEKGTYTYDNRVLTEYTGTRTRIHPHLTVSKMPVVGVGDGVFKDSQTIEYFSVAHNDEFTTIGSETFMNSSLKNVDLFDSVTTIGARAFSGCAQLEELTIPDSVTEIGADAFSGLTGLEKLTILCDPAIIPEGSFANLPALKDVTIAKGAIPARMFEGSGLTRLTLDAGVTEIGANAFANTALTTANLTDVTKIGANAFVNTALTTADLTGVMEIGEGAFENATLEAVRLNANASVGERAFANTKLTQLVIPASGSFPLSAVENTNAELRLSADATDEQLAAWNETLARPWYDPMLREGEVSKFVKMPFKATAAENFEFNPETGLISAYIGTDVDVVVPREIDGVTVVGFANYNAFDSCHDYTDSSVETNRTEWVHLRTLVLPETIQTLPDMMLAYCQQLETFICYAPLESTGSSQFMLCRSLNNVIYVNGVLRIDNYAFDSAGPLGNLYFGEHLESIASQAFNFAGLSSFVADAESVEYGAFGECQNLTSLHFTDKVKSIGENCIINCRNLADVCFDGSDLTTSPMGLMMNVAPKLTVHVPDGMSEENLKHAEKCVSWNSDPVEVTVVNEGCTHEKRTMPDVFALLPEFEADAHAEITELTIAAAPTDSPETAQKPEEAPPSEPASEPAAQSIVIPEEYLGTWYGVSMEMAGDVYPLADLGMEAVLTVSADGMAEIDMNGDVDVTQCVMRDGVIFADTMAFAMKDGQLALSDDEMTILMSREKPEAGVYESEPVDETAELDSFKGVWTVSKVEAEGLMLPPSAADMEGDTLTVYGDTCDLTFGGELLDGLSCRMNGHQLIFELMGTECAVTRHTDGMLRFALDEDFAIWYEYTGDAAEDNAVPPEPDSAPTAAADADSVLERKYVMTNADVNGYNMTAAMLGGMEYSFVLHTDGSVDFVLADSVIPNIKWTQGMVPTIAGGEAEGFIIDYFGQPLDLVATEKGFDMNYLDAMLMHFEPEETAP